MVDANGTDYGPHFVLIKTSFNDGRMWGYRDSMGRIWAVDPETGELSGGRTAPNDPLEYSGLNCTGTEYLRITPTSTTDVPSVNEVFEAPVVHGGTSFSRLYRLRTGPVIRLTNPRPQSIRNNGTCINFVGGDGLFIRTSDAPVVTRPTRSWVVPLRLRF